MHTSLINTVPLALDVQQDTSVFLLSVKKLSQIMVQW
jgi:hypothetical protein